MVNNELKRRDTHHKYLETDQTHQQAKDEYVAKHNDREYIVQPLAISDSILMLLHAQLERGVTTFDAA